MDVSQYLDIFIDETREHLQNLNTQILALEQDAENMDTVNEIFRAAHSLKGMAGTMGYKRMQTLTHDMENVFSEVRNGAIKVNADMIDILFQCLDALENYLDAIQTSADEGTNDNEPLIRKLNEIMNSTGGVAAETSEAPKAKEAPAGGEKWKDIHLDGTDCHVISEAEKQGKKVFSLPGNVDIINSSGTNELIKNGATLVTEVKDILNEFTLQNKEENKEEVNQEYKKVYDVLEDFPMHINEICKKTNSSMAEVNQIITMLEIEGLIKSLPNNQFVKG